MIFRVCLALSGISALIYEVVWMRALALGFGSTTLAVSLALSTFLGGLAAGAYLFGRRAHRFARPARAYAAMELAIGSYGAMSGWLLGIVTGLYGASLERLHLSFAAGSVLQAILAAIVLFVPTALMGGTIPVLLSTSRRSPTGAFSGLYAANTLGATLGAALTGFLLLPELGLQHTLYVAAAVNLVAGALALAAQGEKRARQADAVIERPPTPAAASWPLSGELVTAIVFVSGFSTLLLEVLWTRALELVLGSSTRAFSVMLTVFLVGLAGGSATAVVLIRRAWARPLTLAAVLLGAGAAILGSLWALDASPFWFLQLWSRHHGDVGWSLLSSLAIGSAVLLLPAWLMGLVFPLAASVPGSRPLSEADRVGRLYALNTVGCILGGLLAGLVLVPNWGIHRSILAGAWINIGASAFLAASAIERPGWRLLGLASPLAIGLVLTLIGPAWNPLVMSSGVYFNAASIARDGGYERYRQMLEERHLLFYQEGLTGTVAVWEGKAGRNLAIDGRAESSTGAHAQVLLGHVPFATGRRVQDVFIVGFGTGTTAGMVAMYPVRRIEVVDLEPAVTEASAFFQSINRNPLSDARVHLHFADARNALTIAPPASYDVIMSQPSYPWVSGAAKLFSREFYQLASTRLRPDGLFVQWVQLYNLDLTEVRSLLRTFGSVFPHTLVLDVGANANELLLLGSPQPLQMSWPSLRDMFADPQRRAELVKAGVPDEGSMLASVLMGRAELARFVGSGPINTDDNGLLEFASSSSLYIDTSEGNRRALRQGAGDPWTYVDGTLDQDARQRVAVQMAQASARTHDLARGLGFAQYAVDLGQTAEAYQTLGDVLIADARPQEAVGAWQRALALEPVSPDLMMRLVRFYRSKAREVRPPEYGDWVSRVPAALDP